MVRLANAIKSLDFQPQTNKKGNKANNEGDGRRTAPRRRDARHTCVHEASRAYFFPFLSFSLTLLVHCHTGASRHNAPTVRFDACPG